MTLTVILAVAAAAASAGFFVAGTVFFLFFMEIIIIDLGQSGLFVVGVTLTLVRGPLRKPRRLSNWKRDQEWVAILTRVGLLCCCRRISTSKRSISRG